MDIFIVPRGGIRDDQRECLEDEGGFVVIESDEPDKYRVLRDERDNAPDYEPIGDAITWAVGWICFSAVLITALVVT